MAACDDGVSIWVVYLQQIRILSSFSTSYCLSDYKK